MNFLTSEAIDKKLENWAEQKEPKIGFSSSLNKLIPDQLDGFITSLRVEDKVEWANIIKEERDRLWTETKWADLELVKRIAEAKIENRDRQSEISVFEILDRTRYIKSQKHAAKKESEKESDISPRFYFRACSSCAHRLAQKLRLIAEKAESEQQKQIKIVQNNTPAKRERESWFWKFYEKTMKVIVDAFLQRVWPK